MPWTGFDVLIGRDVLSRLRVVFDGPEHGSAVEGSDHQASLQFGDPRPLLNAMLNEALGRAQVAAGLTEHVTMHRLRHSFAIHSLRAGMDIVTLQELMGHRCISSTIRYLTPDLRRPPGKPFDLLRRPQDRPVIGAIARVHGDDPGLVARLSPHARAALDDIAACGTPACGLHHELCDHCGSHRLAPQHLRQPFVPALPGRCPRRLGSGAGS